jgi:hypothetical protein
MNITERASFALYLSDKANTGSHSSSLIVGGSDLDKYASGRSFKKVKLSGELAEQGHWGVKLTAFKLGYKTYGTKAKQAVVDTAVDRIELPESDFENFKKHISSLNSC